MIYQDGLSNKTGLFESPGGTEVVGVTSCRKLMKLKVLKPEIFDYFYGFGANSFSPTSLFAD